MVHEQMVNGFFAAKLLQILRISKPLNMFYSIFSKQKNTTNCHSACCIFCFSFRNLSNMFPYIRPMSIKLVPHFTENNGDKNQKDRKYFSHMFDVFCLLHDSACKITTFFLT